MSKDLYASLGVTKSASADEIKSAYRKLAKQYHPDANPGDAAAEAKFKEINVAYETLSDATKRANYDKFGSADGPQFGRGGAGGGNPFGAGGMHFDFGDISEMFGDIFGGDIFGGSRTARGRMRGGDIHASVTLSFKEAALGVKKTITFSRMEKCHDCNGTGASGGSVETCRYCNGTGRVRQQRSFGMSVVTPCSACNGTGKIIKNKCDKCRGTGAVKKTVSYEVDIPAGIADGQTINIDGEGDCVVNGGPDGMTGSLLLSVRVTPHPILVRDGFDLQLELPISFTQAILGATVKIPTVDGTADLVIPPYTQNGTRHIMRGKGIKRLNQMGTGDLIVKVLVELPTRLDKRLMDTIKILDSSIPTTEYPKKSKYRQYMS